MAAVSQAAALKSSGAGKHNFDRRLGLWFRELERWQHGQSGVGGGVGLADQYGVFNFTDPGATNLQQFYRLRSP
jgi:hypothetical protein